MATTPTWEEWVKQYNSAGAPPSPVASDTASLGGADLGNVSTLFDPTFGRDTALTHAAENAVGGGWGSGGFAGGQAMNLTSDERKANMLLGHQILEPYLQREADAQKQAEAEKARLNEIAAQGAQALQQLQLSEAGQTARLNSAQQAALQQLAIQGQQAMDQLRLKETGATARQQAEIGGNLADTLLKGALNRSGGAGGVASGGSSARIPGMGTGTPGPMGVTWNRGVVQYGGTPDVVTAPNPNAAYNPNARGVTQPEGVLGATSVDSILRKYGLLPLILISALLLCGCNTSEIEKKSDGSIRAINSRWFWSTESYEVEYSTNGFKAKATKSNPDAESLKAVADGAAHGAASGLNPVKP